MRERARETKREKGKTDGEADVLAKIAEMPKADRDMAKKIHALVKAAGPDLVPRTWYGMPAYALDGKVLCWFKPAEKFKARYATMGFSDVAALDDGNVWPTEYAITELTASDEKAIRALVTKAVH